MQTVVARQSSRVATRATRQSGRVATVSVVCKASPADVLKKVATAAACMPAMIVSHPAFALVDERMNGDGTGRPLGINNGAVGWAMLAVFTTVWTTWYISQRELGDFADEDAGLKID